MKGSEANSVEVTEQTDPMLRHLQRANTLEAIAQGIAVGQAAINEILNGGPKVLGEKPK